MLRDQRCGEDRGVQTQTLRYYERIGLVEPRRTSGNQRMFSRREVERVQRIRGLIDDLGVNLAGVEVVIKLLDRLEQSEEEKDELRGRIRVLEQRLRGGDAAGAVGLTGVMTGQRVARVLDSARLCPYT